MKSSWIAVRAVLEAAQLAGVERERLLRSAGLDPDTQDTYGWIEHELYDALLRSAVELSGKRTFGLHWGGSSPMIEYEFIPLLVANAASLRASLEAAQALQSVLHEQPQMEFRSDGELARICSTADPRLSATSRRVLGDLTMSSGKRLLDYCGRGALRDQAEYWFAFEPGEDEPQYREFYGERVRFACERSEIRFPASMLEIPNPARNNELHTMLEKQFALLRERMSTKLSYVDQVKIELRNARPKLLGMGEAAQALGMSERSLRRRLADEGTTYSDVVESAQIEIAQQLLSAPKATVKDVAFQLGFDSPSGFRRAFRRWTGINPARYRASQGHDPGDD